MTTVSRPRNARSLVGTLLVGLAVALAASPAVAGVENPRDSAVVNAVQLDMATVKRLVAVANVQKTLDDPPPLFLRTKPGKVQKTLPELIAELHGAPELEAAVKAQGFTPREYLVTAMAWANAWFGYFLAQSGDDSAAKMGVPAAQLRFVEQHAAELKALQQND